MRSVIPSSVSCGADTPFGYMLSPNITPDPERGIGRWSSADFRRTPLDRDTVRAGSRSRPFAVVMRVTECRN